VLLGQPPEAPGVPPILGRRELWSLPHVTDQLDAVERRRH
jgi:hypothetical protein